MNPLLFVANVLDPRYELEYLKWSFDDIHCVVESFDMISNVKADLQKLYKWYCQMYQPKNTSNVEVQSSMIMASVEHNITREKPAQKLEKQLLNHI